MRFRFSSLTAVQVVVVLFLLVGSAVLISAPKPVYTAQDKAFYADPNLVNFVRPGLMIKILSAAIAQDGTITARVKFTDPKGLPLDREGITTPGAISASLIAAYIPKGQKQYIAYTTRSQTSPITNKTAVQAGSDSGGKWEKVADGEYVYTFGTKAPADFDKTVTHTIGLYGNRNLEEFELGVNLADTTFNFVPDGSNVAVTRDVVRTATCNKCHDRLSAHGETGRTTVPDCILCHQPQTIDPDTGNTVDFKVMIHKIHRGEDLPSVMAGTKYIIIGNRQSVHDFSDVVFPPTDPDPTRNCQVCHESNTGAAQADAWLTSPSRVACGSCHDNVNFATGENHGGDELPQVSDNQCTTCHIQQGELEFDASIKGAHTTPRFSRDLPGTVFELLNVADGTAGKSPTVTFTLKDKSGAPILPSAMASFSLVMAGPTTDYAITPIRETVTTAQGTSDGRYFWTFTTPIPADAKGSWSIGIEGYRNVTLLPGTKKEMVVRDAGVNKVISFSVDGSKLEPRRTVVNVNNCNHCHFSLSLHGNNRNQIEQCVLCHNPTQTDSVVRPAAQMPPEAIDFRTMIHRIHTGAELGRPYIIYGFRSSVNDFSDVEFPGMRNNCADCHVNGSEQLPLKASLHEVTDPRGFLNPVGPTAAACLGCHSSVYTASHALAQTTRLGESCAACHGPDADFAVSKVHAE